MITIISHQDCAKHNMGDTHPECPQRIEVINQAFNRANLPIEHAQAPLVNKEYLSLAHSKQYIDEIFKHANEKHHYLDPDTLMMEHTLDAALRAAGSATYAVDLVLSGKSQAVFCNTRPPGHHAEQDKAMGFCFFSNAALAAKYALEIKNLNKVVIVDFDVHHGNGTQSVIAGDNKILFLSSYQHPFYPGRYNDESDHIHHIKLPQGADGEYFKQQVQELWLSQINKFAPELLIFSAGFDAHALDPLASINFSNDDYAWITSNILKAAFNNSKQLCKVVSVLEGGYNLDIIGDAAVSHVEAMYQFLNN